MPTPAEHFARELEIYRTEAEAAVQFFTAELAIHATARDSNEVLRLLNRAPLFWNTACGALQAAGFVALGRIFDQGSPHNLDTLLKLAEQHRDIFSKSALRARLAGRNVSGQVADEYLQSSYEPIPSDFRRLRKLVADQRRLYEARYRNIRHQVFAHKGLSNPDDAHALFQNTAISDLTDFLTVLMQIHETLWQLLENGRQLDPLAPITHRLAERLTEETARFLTQCSHPTAAVTSAGTAAP